MFGHFKNTYILYKGNKLNDIFQFDERWRMRSMKKNVSEEFWVDELVGLTLMLKEDIAFYKSCVPKEAPEKTKKQKIRKKYGIPAAFLQEKYNNLTDKYRAILVDLENGVPLKRSHRVKLACIFTELLEIGLDVYNTDALKDKKKKAQ